MDRLITDESFRLLEEMANAGPVICNVVMDEMSIRSQSIYKENYLYGHVENDNNSADSSSLVKQAWVMLAVGLNVNWKLPLGYFFYKFVKCN